MTALVYQCRTADAGTVHSDATRLSARILEESDWSGSAESSRTETMYERAESTSAPPPDDPAHADAIAPSDSSRKTKRQFLVTTTSSGGHMTISRWTLVLVAVTACSGGPGGQSSSASAEVKAGPQPSAVSDTVPGQYIVVLRPGPTAATMTSIRQRAQTLVGDLGAESLPRVFSRVLQGFVLKTTDTNMVQRLRDNPQVRRVVPDRVVRALATKQPNPPSWGLDRIDGRGSRDQSFSYTATGAGVDVYVFDSGINPAHSDFGTRARVWRDLVGDGRNGADCKGHGTHVAGTIGGAVHGVAKGVRLHVARVLDCNGDGFWSNVIAAIDELTRERSAVTVTPRPTVIVNMSLGAAYLQDVDEAITNATAFGILFVVAAGNSHGDACAESPASTAVAFRVAASDESDSRASFSNFGNCVDLFAPGDNITSAWIGGPTADSAISGTSMAAPHVTGVAALFLEQKPAASPKEVKDALMKAGPATEHVRNALSKNDALLFSNY
jgi:aqualysin 1